MDQLVTVLVQTSPIPSHPSTALLEALFRSFRHVDGLLECKIVILCDGCDQISGNERENNKHGKASADTAARYRKHLECLRASVLAMESPFVPEVTGSIELLELKERHGSACAIEAAFIDHSIVNTPFVMICQHDNFFIQNVPLRTCVNAMKQTPGLGIGLKCLHFLSTATLDYTTKVRKRYGLKLEPETVYGINGMLVPLAFWYGRTHVAGADYYRKFVLNRPLRTGDHLEELLGVQQLEDICNRGPTAHKDHGIYVLDQGCGETIYHLSGRRVRATGSTGSTDPVGDARLHDEFRTTLERCNMTYGRSHVRENCSFTLARSCRAIVPGLEVVSEQSQPTLGTPGKRFKQKCFHCGEKGHSYKRCPHMNEAPTTTTINL